MTTSWRGQMERRMGQTLSGRRSESLRFAET